MNVHDSFSANDIFSVCYSFSVCDSFSESYTLNVHDSFSASDFRLIVHDSLSDSFSFSESFGDELWNCSQRVVSVCYETADKSENLFDSFDSFECDLKRTK